MKQGEEDDEALCSGEDPNHLLDFYIWVGEAWERPQNSVLHHNSLCAHLYVS